MKPVCCSHPNPKRLRRRVQKQPCVPRGNDALGMNIDGAGNLDETGADSSEAASGGLHWMDCLVLDFQVTWPVSRSDAWPLIMIRYVLLVLDWCGNRTIPSKQAHLAFYHR